VPKKNFELKVIDVLGSVSHEDFCYMVCSVAGKVFPLLCTRGEGESCRSILSGESKRRGPFGFLADLLKTFKVKLEKAELEAVNGKAIYGKLYFKGASKPVRLSLTEPGIIINTALSMEIPVEVTSSFVSFIEDGTYEYKELKSSAGELWPMPELGSTKRLQIISDFLDKAKA